MPRVRGLENRDIDDDRVMTVTELAQYIHCHPTSIYRLVNAGEIPGFRLGRGGGWRFHLRAVGDWMRSRGAAG